MRYSVKLIFNQEEYSALLKLSGALERPLLEVIQYALGQGFQVMAKDYDMAQLLKQFQKPFNLKVS